MENSSDDPRDAEPTDASRWLDDHGDALFRYALLRLGDRAGAEDLVQETFLAALKARERFAGQATERTWLIGILRHKLADHYRRRTRRRDAGEDDTAPFAAEAVSGRAWSADPAQLFERKEFWQQFRECVEKLPDKLSEAYRLRELRDCSTEDICDLLGVTPTNLALRVYRARIALRACLDRHWFHPPRN